MRKLFLFLTAALVSTSMWATYDVPMGETTLSHKVNNGGRFNVEASGLYHFRLGGGYSWSDGNGIKTQSNQCGVVFYLKEATEIEVFIKHTEAKNAHDVTVHVYSIPESEYKQFDDNKGGASESDRKFSTGPSTSTDDPFTISVGAQSKTFSGKKTLASGYYAVVPIGEKGNTYFNAIKFPVITHVVTINPNGGSYASTPDGWTLSEGVYTKSITEGSFNVPAGLTNGNNDLTGWKDNHDNPITLPFTLEKDTTLVAQWAAHQTSSDATLKDLTVGGETVEGFDAEQIAYSYLMPFGTAITADVPAVAGEANSSYAKSVETTQATSLIAPNNVATIVVTAEDNSTKTYTVTFGIADSKEIGLIWKTGSSLCGGGTAGGTAVKSDDASVSTYINKVVFTNVEGEGEDGSESSSALNVGKKTGNMFTLTSKTGFAFEAMSFFGKIEDANCQYSIDGGEWTTLTSLKTDGDKCYSDIFSNTEVREFRLRSTGVKGVWIRNMQLTIKEASPSTALDNTEAGVKAVKRLENGMLVIEKNGVRYNAMGQIIR